MKEYSYDGFPKISIVFLSLTPFEPFLPRIIAMINIKNSELVIDEKGLYSIEKFIIARKLMYWQVYLHKTVLSAEHTLMKVLKRAKYLASLGCQIYTTPAFKVFLYEKCKIDEVFFNQNNKFCPRDSKDQERYFKKSRAIPLLNFGGVLAAKMKANVA